MKRQWVLGILGIAALAVTLVIVGGRGAWADVPAATGVESVRAPAATLVVTSTADSGIGILRACLKNAAHGDRIEFDTAAFPPTSPATITLTSGLPGLDDGNVTIDASDAGAILDGSGIGTTPETVLLAWDTGGRGTTGLARRGASPPPTSIRRPHISEVFMGVWQAEMASRCCVLVSGGTNEDT